MTRSFSALIALVLLGGAGRAQEPRLVLPNLRDVYSDKVNRPDPGKDVAKLYDSPREAALAAVEPAWLKSSASEAERLKTIMRLEGTAEGQLRRRFDMELWPVLEMTDSIKALNEVGRLARLDKNRWEAPADFIQR